MTSKGGRFLTSLFTQGARLLGHGPHCPADCACRAVGHLMLGMTAALEQAASKAPKAPPSTGAGIERAPSPRPRLVAEVVAKPAARGTRAPVVEAELVDDAADASGIVVSPPTPRPARAPSKRRR